MNTQSNTMPEAPLDSPAVAPGALAPTRPMYWSVRRELWENRSIYLAPLLVGGFVLVGFLVSAGHLPDRRRAVLLLGPEQQQAAIDKPYDIIAMLLIFTGFIVGVFYSLDSLHGDRRDRSILFWKSLPVSDLTTVLSKAAIPLVVLPLVIFATVVATQLVMLVLGTAILALSGFEMTAGPHWPVFEQSLILLYGLIALSLWHAPIYAWLLLISASARRATFLVAVLPLLVLAAVEKIALGSTYFALLLKQRLLGHAEEAFAFNTHGAIHSLAQLTPGRYLSTPGLWMGLGFAAACLAATVRVRRHGGPL